MSVVQHSTYSLPSAIQLLPALEYALQWGTIRIDGGRGAGFSVPADLVPEWLKDFGPLTVYVLPDSVEPELVELSRQDFCVANRDSVDLLARTTVIQLSTQNVCVELDAWSFDLNFFDQDTGQYCLGMIAGGTFVLALHRLDQEEVEVLEIDLQAHCHSSGPNYNPYRIWTEEQLAEAANRTRPVEDWEGDEFQGPRRVECASYVLS